MDEEIEVFGERGVLQAHRGNFPTHGYRRDDGGATPIDEARVYELLGRRLQAKAARNFAAADAAREALRELGVDVFDSSRVWRVRAASRGLSARASEVREKSFIKRRIRPQSSKALSSLAATMCPSASRSPSRRPARARGRSAHFRRFARGRRALPGRFSTRGIREGSKFTRSVEIKRKQTSRRM